MEAISNFLAMGGYGFYIWPCYAVTAVVMIVLLATSLRSLKTREARLRALQGDRPATERRRGGR